MSVDEARKALLPERDLAGGVMTLKSFDFVVYGGDVNYLVDVKGRKAPSGRRATRLESWVTEEDVASLRTWQELFGDGFEAQFVFMYWCESQPPDALFQEVFEHRSRWYAMRTVSLGEYESSMRPRSPRWRTVDLAARDFDRISRPFLPQRATRPRTTAVLV